MTEKELQAIKTLAETVKSMNEVQTGLINTVKEQNKNLKEATRFITELQRQILLLNQKVTELENQKQIPYPSFDKIIC